MDIQEREQRYVETKLRLDMASGRLTSLDGQIVDLAGAMAAWRSSWRRAQDPEAVVARVLSQPWPDRADVEFAFEEWLSAYHAALEEWGRLPPDAQLRLNQPTQPARSALP